MMYHPDNYSIDTNTIFKHSEYDYYGRRFIITDDRDYSFDNQNIEDAVLLEVKPLEWIIDWKTQSLISTKAIICGITSPLLKDYLKTLYEDLIRNY